MTRPPCLLLVAVLLALTGSVLAAPVSSASVEPPTCDGVVAGFVGPGDGTIVGTPGNDVILTEGATVVDAGDGDDLVCITGPTDHGVSVATGPGDDGMDLDVDWDAPLALDAGPGHDELAIRSLDTRRATLDVPRQRLVDDDGIEPEVGLAGFERYFVGAGKVRRMTFQGSAASEFFTSDACLVRAFGHRGRDELRAGPLGEDRCNTIRGVLYGGRGRDVLEGARGSAHGRDRLIGGKGRDQADGGRGRDLCRAEVRRHCERR